MPIHLIRHAESQNNVGGRIWNCDITENGRQQASKLQGHYDLVIVSELKRAQETLKHSNITFDSKIVTKDCAEMGELHKEDKPLFQERTLKFREYLKTLDSNKNIAVVSHYFFVYTMSGLHMPNAHKIEDWSP